MSLYPPCRRLRPLLHRLSRRRPDHRPGGADRAGVASVSSPSGILKVDVTLNPEGRVGYAVSSRASQ